MRLACLDAMENTMGSLAMLAECENIAYAYYKAVAWGGRDAYQDAQSAACVVDWREC